MKFLCHVPLLALFLLGCATDNKMKALTPAEKEAVARIRIYKTNPASKFKFHGVIADEGCHQGEALTGLKLAAVKLGANSVVDFRCHKRPHSRTTDCPRPIECNGSAISIR